MGIAPKDEPIILFYPGIDDDPDSYRGAIEGEWHQAYSEPDPAFDCWMTAFGTFGDSNLPTGWMPLPDDEPA